MSCLGSTKKRAFPGDDDGHGLHASTVLLPPQAQALDGSSAVQQHHAGAAAAQGASSYAFSGEASGRHFNAGLQEEEDGGAPSARGARPLAAHGHPTMEHQQHHGAYQAYRAQDDMLDDQPMAEALLRGLATPDVGTSSPG